jgi:hypothetical protein
MFVNDIKKGTEIIMTGGRYGKMMDNKKGNIRMVEVTNGAFGPEIGSIYAKDILEAEVDGMFEVVELSDRQKDAAKRITAFGF